MNTFDTGLAQLFGFQAEIEGGLEYHLSLHEDLPPTFSVGFQLPEDDNSSKRVTSGFLTIVESEGNVEEAVFRDFTILTSEQSDIYINPTYGYLTDNSYSPTVSGRYYKETTPYEVNGEEWYNEYQYTLGENYEENQDGGFDYTTTRVISSEDINADGNHQNLIQDITDVYHRMVGTEGEQFNIELHVRSNLELNPDTGFPKGNLTDIQDTYYLQDTDGDGLLDKTNVKVESRHYAFGESIFFSQVSRVTQELSSNNYEEVIEVSSIGSRMNPQEVNLMDIALEKQTSVEALVNPTVEQFFDLPVLTA